MGLILLSALVVASQAVAGSKIVEPCISSASYSGRLIGAAVAGNLRRLNRPCVIAPAVLLRNLLLCVILGGRLLLGIVLRRCRLGLLTDVLGRGNCSRGGACASATAATAAGLCPIAEVGPPLRSGLSR